MSLKKWVAMRFNRKNQQDASGTDEEAKTGNAKRKLNVKGIRGKLAASFGAMIVLTLAAALAGLYGLNDVQSRFDNVAQKEIPAIIGATKITSLSERIAAFSARLQGTTNDEDRMEAYDQLIGYSEVLRSTIRKIAALMEDEDAAKQLRITSTRLMTTVDSFNDTISQRIHARRLKLESVEKVLSAHEKLSLALVPMVAAAYFNTMQGGDGVTQRSSEIVDKIVNKDLVELSAAISTRAEANLISGLLTSAEFARGTDILALLNDKAVAAEKRLRAALKGWPDNSAKKQAFAKIDELWALAMSKDGVFKYNNPSNELPAAPRADYIARIVAVQQSLDSLLISAIDDFSYDLSVGAESSMASNTKLIKNLMDKEVKALKTTLETSNSLYQLVATLVQASWAVSDDALKPLQPRIDAAAMKLKKALKGQHTKSLKPAIGVLLKAADAGQGLASLRRLELQMEVEANRQMLQTHELEGKLGGLLGKLVAARQKTVEKATKNVNATIKNSMYLLLGTIALSLMVAALIGVIVVNKGLVVPLTHVTKGMLELAQGNTSADLGNADRTDEIGDMTRAVQVFRDNELERDEMRREQEKDTAARAARQKRVDDLITSFRGSVQEVLTSVSTNMEQMQSTAQVLTELAEDTTNRATTAASASEEASGNVQTVASASEELSSSISEISRQISHTTEIVDNATEAARATNDKVSDLANGAQKIGDVVSLIQDIAEQTNLLALNATIEAARAGEMGKGFAVVASEVKSLANQTASATEEISTQISAIQSSTGEAVEAIKEISATMEEANTYTAAIAKAVEQQGAATADISHNVQMAATGTQDVANNISSVTAAVSETTQSAAQVEHASGDVADQAKNLRQTIDRFLSEVAAA